MGNIPGKITGRYQSYDINKELQETSASSSTIKSHLHVHQQSVTVASTPASTNSQPFESSYQYAFQRANFQPPMCEKVNARNNDYNFGNTLDDDDDEANGTFHRPNSKQRQLNDDELEFSEKLRKSLEMSLASKTKKSVEKGRFNQYDDDDDEEDHREEAIEDEYEEPERKHAMIMADDRDDSTSREADEDLNQAAEKISIINEKGIDCGSDDYEHGNLFISCYFS